MSHIPYLSLEEVISDKKLMKPCWESLSRPQQVAILAFYGQPLTSPADMAIWSILNDQVVYDALGYPLSITPFDYSPKEYSIFVGILGRRAGKSAAITAFVALYEILFGGHLDHVTQGQDVIVPYIAQDLATAKANMGHIALMSQKSPTLEKQIKNATRDKIEFTNGIVVLPEPPAIKTGRGFAMPIVIGDEVGFWYRTSEAANPDYEVQRAVSYAQLQFPRAKQILISTPYTEEGLLWDYWKAGTGGHRLPLEDQGEFEDTLVLQASTAAMENPRITKKKLSRLQAEDPEAFVRESLARFVTAISGFIPPELVQKAIQPQIKVRTKSMNETGTSQPTYVGCMDPAFRHDSFAFSIFHMNQDGEIVQDLLKTWTPDKKLKISLDPSIIIAEIAQLVVDWNLTYVVSDQYQLEALQQLAQQHKFSIIGHDFTGKSKAKMYGSLIQLLRTYKIKLLDIPIIYQQLTQLQKKLNAMGGISVAAPPGKHDDVASVIALGCTVALQAYPMPKLVKKSKTLFDEGLECIRRKQAAQLEDAWV
jgi:hypothetical protein